MTAVTTMQDAESMPDLPADRKQHDQTGNEDMATTCSNPAETRCASSQTAWAAENSKPMENIGRRRRIPCQRLGADGCLVIRFSACGPMTLPTNGMPEPAAG